MSKKSDLHTLRARQQARQRSNVEMNARIKTQTEAIQKTAIKQQLDYLRDSNVALDKKMVFPDWSKNDELYEKIAHGIVEISQGIANNYEEVENAGRATPAFRQMVVTAVNDCDEYTKKLVSIHQLHQGKTGKVADIAELDLYYSIGGQYTDLFDSFRQTIFAIGTEIHAFVMSINEANNIVNLVEETVNSNKKTENDAN